MTVTLLALPPVALPCEAVILTTSSFGFFSFGSEVMDKVLSFSFSGPECADLLGSDQ